MTYHEMMAQHIEESHARNVAYLHAMQETQDRSFRTFVWIMLGMAAFGLFVIWL